MDEHDGLAERFEAHRGRLKAVAYRMLGSLSEADDAVQEAWLRLDRADAGGVDPEQEALLAEALAFARLAQAARPAPANGAAGLVVAPGGRPFSVMGFSISGGKIVEIDILADPARVGRLDLAVLDD